MAKAEDYLVRGVFIVGFAFGKTIYFANYTLGKAEIYCAQYIRCRAQLEIK